MPCSPLLKPPNKVIVKIAHMQVSRHLYPHEYIDINDLMRREA